MLPALCRPKTPNRFREDSFFASFLQKQKNLLFLKKKEQKDFCSWCWLNAIW
jgi:hypothetical protein